MLVRVALRVLVMVYVGFRVLPWWVLALRVQDFRRVSLVRV